MLRERKLRQHQATLSAQQASVGTTANVYLRMFTRRIYS